MIYKKNRYNVVLLVVIIFLVYVFSKLDGFFNPMPKMEIVNGSVKKFNLLHVGDSAIHYFRIKNVGKEDLKILNISSSCGCTVPYWNASPIKPGSQDSIKVVYDTSRVGPFNQSIEVYTNSQNKKEYIHILGIVEN